MFHHWLCLSFLYMLPWTNQIFIYLKCYSLWGSQMKGKKKITFLKINRESVLMHWFTLVLGELYCVYNCFHYIVCCYPTAGCCWMQWPMCWCVEASAPGLDKPSEYLTLQAVISSQSRLKTRCTLRQQLERSRQADSWGSDWLISLSPEVLHSWASSLLSQEPGCYCISTLLKGQHTVEEGGRGWRTSSSLPSPEALHKKITASCQLAVFCAAIIFLCFLKNQGKEWKKSLMTL